jgi:hypothetical protein
MQLVYSTNIKLTDLFHFKQQQKTLMEATLEDLYTLLRHCKGTTPLGVIPLSFAHFGDYVPDKHRPKHYAHD